MSIYEELISSSIPKVPSFHRVSQKCFWKPVEGSELGFISLARDIDDDTGTSRLAAVMPLLQDLLGGLQLQVLPRPPIRGRGARGRVVVVRLLVATARANILVLAARQENKSVSFSPERKVVRFGKLIDPIYEFAR